MAGSIFSYSRQPAVAELLLGDIAPMPRFSLCFCSARCIIMTQCKLSVHLSMSSSAGSRAGTKAARSRFHAIFSLHLCSMCVEFSPMYNASLLCHLLRKLSRWCAPESVVWGVLRGCVFARRKREENRPGNAYSLRILQAIKLRCAACLWLARRSLFRCRLPSRRPAGLRQPARPAGLFFRGCRRRPRYRIAACGW